MAFYRSIAPWYDQIFPPDPVAVDWVRRRLGIAGGFGILDVGCATGSLLLALSDTGLENHGLDLDGELLAQARSRLGEAAVRQGSMLELQTIFGANKYQAVTCLGNTLVHLGNIDQVKDFLTQAKACGGQVLIQIINFDRVIDQKIESLPTLETDTLRFSRAYSRVQGDGRLTFSTKLEIKPSPENPKAAAIALQNSIPLLALRRDQLGQALTAAGFAEIDWFADFHGNPWRPDSFLTICAAR